MGFRNRLKLVKEKLTTFLLFPLTITMKKMKFVFTLSLLVETFQ